jgi:hypothetical protein
MAVLNFDLVSNLHLAPEPSQLHTMVADIERMREMAIFTPGNPESYWQHRFGSLRPPFPCAKSRHVSRSLRVTVVGFVVTIAIVFTIAFVFLFFFLVGLLSKEDIGSHRPIRRV